MGRRSSLFEPNPRKRNKNVETNPGISHTENATIELAKEMAKQVDTRDNSVEEAMVALNILLTKEKISSRQQEGINTSAMGKA